mmetsp:Transcript_3995/g.5753  ORF Transcript_3995/g.5753 Transcript_3995/m.5753 type:complete len:343 (-) Transcript_3995:40-1068(-)
MGPYLKIRIFIRPTSGEVLLLLLLVVIPAVVLAFVPPHPYHHNLNAPTAVVSSSALCARRNIVVVSHNVSQDVADGFFDVSALLTGRVDVLTRCISSALWVSNGVRKDTSVFLMLFPQNITIEVRGEKIRGLNPDERTTALYLQRTLLDGGDVPSASSEEDGLPLSSQEQRRQVKLDRLQERDLGKPETINPFKPGAWSGSQKEYFRSARRRRQNMARQINRSAKAGTPHGFIFHKDDTLEKRLKLLLASTETNHVYMMDELGEPLLDVLLTSTKDDIIFNHKGKKRNNTTIILGDQIGYSPCDEKLLAENDSVRKVSLGPVSLLTSQCITIAHNFLDIRDN